MLVQMDGVLSLQVTPHVCIGQKKESICHEIWLLLYLLLEYAVKNIANATTVYIKFDNTSALSWINKQAALNQITSL